jgi:hypothetical protein
MKQVGLLFGRQENSETNSANEQEAGQSDQNINRSNDPERKVVGELVAVGLMVRLVYELDPFEVGVGPNVAAYEPDDYEKSHERVEHV